MGIFSGPVLKSIHSSTMSQVIHFVFVYAYGLFNLFFLMVYCR